MGLSENYFIINNMISQLYIPGPILTALQTDSIPYQLWIIRKDKTIINNTIMKSLKMA